MTAPQVRVVELTGGRYAISGPIDHVGLVLHQARDAGRLVSASAPQVMGGEVVVTLKLLPEPAQAVARRTPTAPRHTPTGRLVLVGASVGVGLGGVAAVAWAVAAVLGWAAGHLAEIAGAAAVVLLGAALATRLLVRGDDHPCNR